MYNIKAGEGILFRIILLSNFPQISLGLNQAWNSFASTHFFFSKKKSYNQLQKKATDNKNSFFKYLITFFAVHSIKSFYVSITGIVVLFCFLLTVIIFKMKICKFLFCLMKQALTLWSACFPISVSGITNFLKQQQNSLYCSFVQVVDHTFWVLEAVNKASFVSWICK